MQKAKKTICLIVFMIYIYTVLNLTIIRFGSHYDERQLSLVLFSNLIKVYRNIGLMEFLRLFLGNIGWFVPFGFLLPMMIKKTRLLEIVILSFFFSFGIETLQFIFRKGVAEIDDLLLNILGAVIGYLLYKRFSRSTGEKNVNLAQDGMPEVD